MDAAAVLHVKTQLARPKHQCALTTNQLVLLTDKAKVGLGTDQVVNPSQAWKLRCDGSVDEAEHKEDLGMILREVRPGESGAGITEPVGGSQGSLRLAGAPHRPASKGEKENDRALKRSAAAG